MRIARLRIQYFWPVCLILVPALLWVLSSEGTAIARFADSAHGDTTDGVNRTGEVMKTTLCILVFPTIMLSIFGCATHQEYKHTVLRGIQFLIDTNDRYQHDALLLLEIIYNKTRKEELKDIYETNRARLLAKPHPFNILLNKEAYDKDRVQDYLKANLYQPRRDANGRPIFSTRATDDIIIRALYCQYFPFSEEIFVFMVQNIRDNGGYLSTHALYALDILRQNGCYKIDEIERFMPEIANEIESAQLADDSFSDLYAERVMLLLYFGYKNKVRRNWINKIIKSQNKDGSWPMFGTSHRGRIHPTVLSMVALLLYYED